MREPSWLQTRLPLVEVSAGELHRLGNLIGGRRHRDHPDVAVAFGIEVALVVAAIDGAGDDVHIGLVLTLAWLSLGFAFLLRSAFSMSSPVVELRKAMRLPSGDHTGPEAPLGRSVIIAASPPASDSIASCAGFGLPARLSPRHEPDEMRAIGRPARLCIVLAVRHPDGSFLAIVVNYPD